MHIIEIFQINFIWISPFNTNALFQAYVQHDYVYIDRYNIRCSSLAWDLTPHIIDSQYVRLIAANSLRTGTINPI